MVRIKQEEVTQYLLSHSSTFLTVRNLVLLKHTGTHISDPGDQDKKNLRFVNGTFKNPCNKKRKIQTKK